MQTNWTETRGTVAAVEQDVAVGSPAYLAARYAALTAELQEIEHILTKKAMDAGKSMDFGPVSIKYTKGKKTYDYETPGQEAALDIINACKETKVDWRRVCTAANIAPDVLKVSEPTAKIKVKEL